MSAVSCLAVSRSDVATFSFVGGAGAVASDTTPISQRPFKRALLSGDLQTQVGEQDEEGDR
jgi:hypothetical protein